MDPTETPDSEKSLDELTAEFVVVKRRFDKDDKRIKVLKPLIRVATAALAPDVAEPITEGMTVSVPVRGGHVTISKTEAAPPPLDPGKFLGKFGPDMFFRFIDVDQVTVPSKAFRAGEWTRAVAAEEVSNQDMQDCLGPKPEPKEWSVGVKK